jgi:hypothetical protein
MSKPLTFDVPWDALVSDNRKYVTGYILSKEYRQAKQLIAEFAIAAAKRAKWVRQEGRLALDIVVRYPDRRRRDLQPPKGRTGRNYRQRSHLVGRQPDPADFVVL